jgi:hypothetical protein
MGSVLSAVRALVWFIYQAVMVGGAGAAYFFVPFAILVGLAVIGFVRRDTDARQRIWIPVVLFPAIWILTGLWGGLFWCDWTGRHGPCPHWAEYPILIAPWLSLLAAVVFLTYQRGARLFLAGYSLINIYLTFAVSFVSGMAVTGIWL